MDWREEYLRQISGEREALKTVPRYKDSLKWQVKVDCMRPAQVHAVYLDFQKRGMWKKPKTANRFYISKPLKRLKKPKKKEIEEQIELDLSSFF